MKSKVLDFVAKYSRILVLVLLIVVSSALAPKFLTVSNMITILQQSSLMLIMALGMTCAMLLGRGVDMSIGSTLAIANALSASYMVASKSTGSIVTGILISLAVGCGIGLLNGVLIAYLNLPAILVTFATREIFRGCVYAYLKGRVIMGMHPVITFLGSGRIFKKIPVTILIAFALALIVSIFLRRTRKGRELYLVGANPSAADFSGINAKAVTILAFTLSGLFASIAGIIYLGRLGSAESEIGMKFAIQCVSAVAIGGISFNGGMGNVSGAIIGCIILNMINNTLNQLKIDPYWQGTATGLIILLAVILDHFARKRLGNN